MIIYYNDYYNTVNNKLRRFHNVTPGRVVHFSLRDAEQLCSITPSLSYSTLVLTDFELLRPVISSYITGNETVHV